MFHSSCTLYIRTIFQAMKFSMLLLKGWKHHSRCWPDTLGVSVATSWQRSQIIIIRLIIQPSESAIVDFRCFFSTFYLATARNSPRMDFPGSYFTTKYPMLGIERKNGIRRGRQEQCGHTHMYSRGIASVGEVDNEKFRPKVVSLANA